MERVPALPPLKSRQERDSPAIQSGFGRQQQPRRIVGFDLMQPPAKIFAQRFGIAGRVRPSVVNAPCTAFGPPCVEYRTSPWKAIPLWIRHGRAISSGMPRAIARCLSPLRPMLFQIAMPAKSGSAVALKRIMDSMPAAQPIVNAEREYVRAYCKIKLRKKTAVEKAARHSVKTRAAVKMNVGRNSPISTVARAARSPNRCRAVRRATRHRGDTQRENE